MAKKYIVVADDQPGVRCLLSEVLSRDKYVLLEAGSGEEAIDFIQQQEIDLVFLDVKMPRLDGVTTLKKILLQPRHPPVVIMTAQGQDDLRRRVLDMGASAYLEKPFDIDVIARLVAKLSQ